MDRPFLLALSSPEPIPGGGAASAHGACVGHALLEKIIRVELRRHQAPPELISLWEALLEQVRAGSENLYRLRDEDGRCYTRFAAAKRGEEGDNTLTTALVSAIRCPVEIMEKACQGLNFVSEAVRHCQRHLISDLLVSGELIMAAVRGSYHIAHANLRLLSDLTLGNDFQKRLEHLYSYCIGSFETLQREMAARSTRQHAGF